MTQAVVDDWSEIQLQRVVQTVVKAIEADPDLTLAAAILRAQSNYIQVIDRLSNADAAAYTKHHWRLAEALKKAGVIYPNRAAGIKVTLQSLTKAQSIATKYADLLPQAPAAQPTAPVLYTLDEALAQLMPGIKQAIQHEVKLQVAAAFREEKKSNVVPIVDKKIKVLVVAQHRVALQELQQQAYANPDLRDVEFRVWRADDTVTKLKQWLHWADSAFVLTDHISHEAFNVVKSFTGTRHVPVNGTLTALVRSLGDFYSPGERLRQAQKHK